MIPYGRQDVTQADIDAVVAVLRSDFLTQGPVVPRFEERIASAARVKHAVAMNSATSALHVACMALGVGPGDVVWTVPNTFVASANCARYCGADVDFVDIDRDTWNISVAALRERLVAARRSGRLPKVVIPVHFSGQPTPQAAIWELAKEYGFHVIEDASHSVGGSRDGEPVGSCRWSDITVLSFHPVKIITSGEGGMALTNDDALAHALAMGRSHGITRQARLYMQAPLDVAGQAPAWYYEQQSLGFNYRLTDIHAALGLSQMDRLEANVERRNALASRYDRALAGLPLQLPRIEQGSRSAYHLYVVRVAPEKHRRTFEALRQRDIGVNLHYMPVHLQPYYRSLGFRPGQFPESEAFGASAFTLPLYAALSDADQDRVIAAVREVVTAL